VPLQSWWYTMRFGARPDLWPIDGQEAAYRPNRPGQSRTPLLRPPKYPTMIARTKHRTVVSRGAKVPADRDCHLANSDPRLGGLDLHLLYTSPTQPASAAVTFRSFPTKAGSARHPRANSLCLRSLAFLRKYSLSVFAMKLWREPCKGCPGSE